MKLKTPFQTQKETRRQERGAAPRAAVRKTPESDMVPVNSTDTRFAHNFSQVPVRPGASVTSQDYSKASCPISPQRCPFGGACHTCPPKVQAKLKIGQPGDRYEQEADRVADQVMRMPGHHAVNDVQPLIQRLSGQSNEQLDAELVDVAQAIASPGRALESVLLQDMEQRFSHDFSQVLIHTGVAAEHSAQAVNAHAYTVGRNIVFGTGRFEPGTHAGQRLIAHELTHVVQQSGSDKVHLGQSNEKRGLTSRPTDLMIQRDLAIKPPRPAAAGRVLTPAEMANAITFNNRVLGSIANSADIIEMIRDVIGIRPLPAVVDAEFVNGVIQWQANFGLTQDGKLGSKTARPLFREIGAEGVGRGQVSRSPRYTPAGPINVPRGGPHTAHFDMSAEFRSDPRNGIFPSCCEVRQEIQWDAAYVTANVAAGAGAVPHPGFPAAHPANTWIEDRNVADTLRYGHRMFYARGPGNRYLDSAGRQNQAFGRIYEGEDNPTDNPPFNRGSWSFRLGVYDVCNGNRLLAFSPRLVVNWL